MTAAQARLLGLAAMAVVAAGVWMLRPRENPPVVIPVGSPAASPAQKYDAPAAKEVAPSPHGVLSLLGSVQSQTQATLSARSPGRIAAVSVGEGDAVRAGQIVVMLDETDVRNQIRQAEAAVSAARAQVNRAERAGVAQRGKADADVEAARIALQSADDRARQAAALVDIARLDQQTGVRLAQENVHKSELGLAQANQNLTALLGLEKIGGVARNDLESARRQAAGAESDLSTARAQLAQASAVDAAGGAPAKIAAAQRDLEAARESVRGAQTGLRLAQSGRAQSNAVAASDLEAARATVTEARAAETTARAGLTQLGIASPIGGVVRALNAHVGESAQPGVPLLTVVSLTGLRVEALVPARQLAGLIPGQAARISVETAPDRSYGARVSEIGRIAEPDGRTFRVRFVLTAPSDLRPGQTARIRVEPRP